MPVSLDPEGSSEVEITLRRASIRALVAFLLLLLVGGLAIMALVRTSDLGPVATVVAIPEDPVTVRSPDRPARYPAELPTFDNITLLAIRPEPGALLVELASPVTPAAAIAMVREALEEDGWEFDMVSSANRLIGFAEKGEERIGIEVTGDERSGTPTGWIAINILLVDEPLPPPPVEVLPPPTQSTN